MSHRKLSMPLPPQLFQSPPGGGRRGLAFYWTRQVAESEGTLSLVWVGPVHSGSLCHSDGPSPLLLLDNLCLFACVTSMADTLLSIRLLSAAHNMCRESWCLGLVLLPPGNSWQGTKMGSLAPISDSTLSTLSKL